MARPLKLYDGMMEINQATDPNKMGNWRFKKFCKEQMRAREPFYIAGGAVFWMGWLTWVLLWPKPRYEVIYVALYGLSVYVNGWLNGSTHEMKSAMKDRKHLHEIIDRLRRM